MKRENQKFLVIAIVLTAFFHVAHAEPNTPESVVPPNETQDSLPQNMPEMSRDLDRSKPAPSRGQGNIMTSGGGQAQQARPSTSGGGKGKKLIP